MMIECRSIFAWSQGWGQESYGKGALGTFGVMELFFVVMVDIYTHIYILIYINFIYTLYILTYINFTYIYKVYIFTFQKH